MIVPRKILDQHVAILGKTRSGKSSVMRGLVEDLLDRQLPVCIVDPKGDWWGIKLAADGKGPGYPVVIFGNSEHGDVPINEHAGAHVAELFATGNRPCLIDLGGWTVDARTKFWIDFASTLFKHTKGERWLAVDEVHNFCPKGKVLSPQAGTMLHWTNRLASEGLGKGLALLFASQRPQKVHNDTLTSAETLIAMRVLHPSDREAVSDWIKGCGDSSGSEVLGSLAQMERGEGWVWSPEIGFGPKRVKFPLFKTYDSFRPQTVADAKRLKGWAEVDLDDVRAKMATFIERAKADDPRELRKQLAEANRMLANQAKAIGELQARRPAGKEKRVEVPVLNDAQIARLEKVVERYAKLLDAVIKHHGDLREPMQQLLSSVHAVNRRANAETAVHAPGLPRGVEVPRASGRPGHQGTRDAAPARRILPPVSHRSDAGGSGRASSNGHVTPRQQRFLDAAATLTTLATEVTRESVSAWIGVHPRGGSVGNELRALEDAGMIVNDRGTITVTEAGMAAATPMDPSQAINSAKAGLSNRQAKFFDIIAAAYPHGVTREAIAEQVGIHPRGGSLGNDLGRLVGRGLVERDRGAYRAREFLFASN